MKVTAHVLAMGVVAVLAVPSAAQTVLTNDAKMTLYTFDQDKDGKSACYDDCAAKWPPYLGKTGEKKGEGWTLVERTDGAMQWAYDGKPTYLYADDKLAGDKSGDGKGGVWHVIAE